MTGSTHDSSILIVGGGTWGCAIAYRLAKRGFRDVKVLDANEFPSRESAGNDVNKIMEEREFLVLFSHLQRIRHLNLANFISS
jgi:sarcosine oxidase / L-pipecolate oxidase